MMKAILRGSIFSLLLLGVASDRRLEWLQGSVRSQTWPGVPVTAFRLQNPPQSAKVNLNRVLTPEELQKLLNIKDKVHVLSKINFNSPQKMTLEAFTMHKK